MSELSPSLPVETAREIARQGEARLNALLDLATAADLRATTLCGIFGASSIGLTAAVLTYVGAAQPAMRLIVSGAATAFFLFAAAIVAAFAGAPRDFYIAGGNPDNLRDWSWTGEGWRTETELLDATGQRFAKSIDYNVSLLAKGSRRVNGALWTACASFVVGVGCYFIFPCLTHLS